MPKLRWPGARLPHVWSGPNVALHDRIGDGYTALRLAPSAPDPAPLIKALETLGAPAATLDAYHPTLRALDGADLLLIRPDLHVAWRGDRLPDDPALLARLVTGHIDPSAHKGAL